MKGIDSIHFHPSVSFDLSGLVLVLQPLKVMHVFEMLKMLKIINFALPQRVVFKLGARNLFLLCCLVKNMSAVLLSAVYSTDRSNFSESEKAVPDQNWINGHISSD